MIIKQPDSLHPGIHFIRGRASGAASPAISGFTIRQIFVGDIVFPQTGPGKICLCKINSCQTDCASHFIKRYLCNHFIARIIQNNRIKFPQTASQIKNISCNCIAQLLRRALFFKHVIHYIPFIIPFVCLINKPHIEILNFIPRLIIIYHFICYPVQSGIREHISNEPYRLQNRRKPVNPKKLYQTKSFPDFDLKII